MALLLSGGVAGCCGVAKGSWMSGKEASAKMMIFVWVERCQKHQLLPTLTIHCYLHHPSSYNVQENHCHQCLFVNRIPALSHRPAETSESAKTKSTRSATQRSICARSICARCPFRALITLLGSARSWWRSNPTWTSSSRRRSHADGGTDATTDAVHGPCALHVMVAG